MITAQQIHQRDFISFFQKQQHFFCLSVHLASFFICIIIRLLFVTVISFILFFSFSFFFFFLFFTYLYEYLFHFIFSSSYLFLQQCVSSYTITRQNQTKSVIHFGTYLRHSLLSPHPVLHPIMVYANVTKRGKSVI